MGRGNFSCLWVASPEDIPSRAFSCTLERDIMDNIVIILRYLKK
ncbi:hypothetical protein ALC57_13574 [Trachymyrmex cornetzi]|uniref:Uncharacterized protein n=1 Tax=Trachymyrmex cornetzi TaxID=471704 RepID=A0A195DNK4_9HYME|nr:hypothetical protein ALC57_13574 [Trachymyrmex cornetzi]